ncbi:PRC-barrel domain-containing protein [Candidatus Peregrinibacteria bacterium]|nr:PRC-barrel domain-containing protein [Candidatus Peregrinibacteria bacterium]
MQKPYSEIIGLPVIIEGLGRAGRITDALIDTKDGKVAGFVVNNSLKKIIAPIDILFFGQAVVIGDPEDIIDPSDYIKAKETIEKDIWILHSRVETLKGEYLGKIYDYYLDVSYYGLIKIVVYKSFFGLLKTPERIIPAKDIVRIKKGLVIVKNQWAKQPVKHAQEEPLKNFYPDMAA